MPMKQTPKKLAIADRRVHCTIAPPNGPRIEIVRYNRAGHWYYEDSSGFRRGVSFDDAVRLTLNAGWAATWHEGVPGGRVFDARIRAARKKKRAE